MAFSDLFNPINSISNMILGYYDRKKKNEENEIMREREDNAVVRHVQDLQNAGLSPLADMDGSNASLGATTEPNDAENIERETANPEALKQEKNATLQGEEDLRSKKLENDSKEIELIYQEEEHQIELERKKTEMEKLIAESKESNSRGDYFEQEVVNKKKELEMLKQQIEESKNRVDLMRSESDLNKSKKERQDIENEFAIEYENEKNKNLKADTKLKGRSIEKIQSEIELNSIKKDIEKLNKIRLEQMTPIEINDIALKYEMRAQEKQIEWSEFTRTMTEHGFVYDEKTNMWKYNAMMAHNIANQQKGRWSGVQVLGAHF